MDYRAVVEVKSPVRKQAVYHKDYKRYNKYLKTQLRRHLSATNNNKVILTDAMNWELYKKSEKAKDIAPIQPSNCIIYLKNVYGIGKQI